MRQSLDTRINKNKAEFIDQLKRTPIIQLACEKIGIARATVYRWKEDKEFLEGFDKALHEGRMLVNDVAESQLMAAIRERNMTAILFWLKHHHPDYANKLEIKHAIHDNNLTPEQEALVREALRLATLSEENVEINQVEQTNELQQEKHNSAGTGGSDDQRQEGANSDH